MSRKAVKQKKLVALLSIAIGLLILIQPPLLDTAVGLYLILVGLLDLFDRS